MNNDLVITLVILGGAILLFLSERLPVDLVALLVLAALGLSGVLTSQEVFSGFSRSAIIIIAAILVLADGLERTGVSHQVGVLLLRVAGTSETRLIVVTMVASGCLSLVMNNIAAVSVLLPAVLAAGRKAGVDRTRLLIPLAFGTLLGGMATLLTTTNIVASSLLREHALAGFGMLDFAGVGLPLAVTGVLYMALWGRRLLPAAGKHSRETIAQQEQDVTEAYGLEGYLFRARIPPGSDLCGKRLSEAGFTKRFGVNIAGIDRAGITMLTPPLDTVFAPGDVLILTGEMEELLLRDVEKDLETLPLTKWQRHQFESDRVCVVEAILSPRSHLIGQTLPEAHFREKSGFTVLAIWRVSGPGYVGIQKLPLEFGDALLMMGPRQRLAQLRSDSDLILVSGDHAPAPTRIERKGWLALVFFAATILLAATGRWPVAEVMMGGALAMVLTNIVTMEQAYRAIEWRLIILVAGVLPLGIAMTKTKAADLLAHWLVMACGSHGPMILLIGLMALTVLLSQAIKGGAVCAIMVPIAVQSGLQIGAHPRALVMGVALATSMAFITPLGHPVNILVMGEGGYKFKDFFRVGLPLTVLLFIVVLLVLPLFWPLT